MVNPYQPPESDNKPVVYDFLGILTGLSILIMSISIMLSAFNVISVKRPLFIDSGLISFIILLSVFSLGCYCGKRK